MVTTMRSLLAVPEFHLVVLNAPRDEAVLDQPLTWVHSSDLPDPTPWLQPGQLLLTDGDYFRKRRTDQKAADDYIAELRKASVVGLGFATMIIHDEVPTTLIRAARDADFPLLEVADRTPFMSIIRHVADDIAAADRERLEWLTGSQRAIARAALRVDGLTAILGELEARLDCWVALYDVAGNQVAVPASRPIPHGLVDVVADEVQRILRSQIRSAGRIVSVAGEVTLQTLGQRDRLRGILAIGNPAPLDPAGSDLVASVMAIASVALEQSAALEESRQSLRSGLLQLLIAGNVDVARRTLRRLGTSLPDDPVRVLVTPFDGQRAIVEELEIRAQSDHGLFFAIDDERLVLVVSLSAYQAIGPVLNRHRLSAGTSAPTRLGDLGAALAEAEWALASASGHDGHGIHAFDTLLQDGMLGQLGHGGGPELARRLLEPVTSRPDGDEFLHAATVWLDHNGAWDPAAKELSLHRHTLKSKMAVLGHLLDLDLEVFAGRAELWAALRFANLPVRERSGSTPPGSERHRVRG